MSNPRRHHYCPESFLAWFTTGLTRDGTLWVFDRTKHQIRKSIPKNEGHQRDFYRVDVNDGSDPFFLEKQFSDIEGGAKHAIDFILKEKRLPDVKSMEFLLSFAGLLAVRTPSYRKKMAGVYEELAKKVMEVACADEKMFEATKNRLIDEGHDLAELTYEDTKEFVEKDDYTVGTPQNQHLVTMLKSAATITECLYQRNWIIAVAVGGEYICSDNPIGLDWSKKPTTWRSPGFGLSGTEVTIPISKGIALIGIFETPPYTTATLDRAGVANLNNKSIQRAERYIYGSNDDFIWRNEKGDVVNAKEYFFTHGHLLPAAEYPKK